MFLDHVYILHCSLQYIKIHNTAILSWWLDDCYVNIVQCNIAVRKLSLKRVTTLANQFQRPYLCNIRIQMKCNDFFLRTNMNIEIYNLDFTSY